MEALESNTYTTEKTLAEQMNERLKELHMAKAEAAMKMNYSRSAVSQYLNGKYASDPTELEKKIKEFLIATGGMSGVQDVPDIEEGTGVQLKAKVEFFESRDFVNTIGVCQACQENIGLGIVVGKSGQGRCFISPAVVISGSSIIATAASIVSPRLCVGIFVARPTAIPDVPFTSRFGYRAGSMSGSLRVSSKFRRKGTVSFSISRSISSASGAMRASVYRMAAALSPSMEPKLP